MRIFVTFCIHNIHILILKTMIDSKWCIVPAVVKKLKNNRHGHASKGRGNTRINAEIKDSLSRRGITVSLHY
jgi:hypothetical protein